MPSLKALLYGAIAFLIVAALFFAFVIARVRFGPAVLLAPVGFGLWWIFSLVADDYLKFHKGEW